MSAISSRTFAISSFCIEGQSEMGADYTERRDSRGSLLTATPGELASFATKVFAQVFASAVFAGFRYVYLTFTYLNQPMLSATVALRSDFTSPIFLNL